MRGLSMFVLQILFVGIIFGQNTFTSKRDSDPKAKMILDKLKKQYDSYKIHGSKI
jgi:hypothetical protein